MVITPDETRKLTTDERTKLRALEKAIDTSLREGRLTLSVSLVPVRIRDKIVQMYEGAGWNVRYISDQREGDYFQFSEDGGSQPYWNR